MDYFGEQNSRGHDQALVCKNGHIINAHATSDPEFNEKHCTTCGEEAIRACDCGSAVQGELFGIGVGGFSPPAPSPKAEAVLQASVRTCLVGLRRSLVSF